MRLARLPRSPLDEQALENVLDPRGRSQRLLDPGPPRPGRTTARSPGPRSPNPFDSSTSGTPGAKYGSPTTRRPRRPISTTTRSDTDWSLRRIRVVPDARGRARSHPQADRREEASHERRSDRRARAGAHPLRAAAAQAHGHGRGGGACPEPARGRRREDARAEDPGRLRPGASAGLAAPRPAQDRGCGRRRGRRARSRGGARRRLSRVRAGRGSADRRAAGPGRDRRVPRRRSVARVRGGPARRIRPRADRT